MKRSGVNLVEILVVIVIIVILIGLLFPVIQAARNAAKHAGEISPVEYREIFKRVGINESYDKLIKKAMEDNTIIRREFLELNDLWNKGHFDWKDRLRDKIK